MPSSCYTTPRARAPHSRYPAPGFRRRLRPRYPPGFRRRPALGFRRRPALGFRRRPALGFRRRPAPGFRRRPAPGSIATRCEAPLHTLRHMAFSRPASPTQTHPWRPSQPRRCDIVVVRCTTM